MRPTARLPGALATVVVTVLATVAAVLVGPPAAAAGDDAAPVLAPVRAPVRADVIATSRAGRPIVARLYGDPAGAVRLVVIGQMHGSEPGGRRVVETLARKQIPPGVALWLVSTVNPDGASARTRGNARGVDLNRNFPTRWQAGRRGSAFWPGPAAASEPETRGVMAWLTAIAPTAVLSMHQAYDRIDTSAPGSRAAGRRLAAWMGERAAAVGCPGPCHGTMTQWIARRLGAVAVTVELDRRVSAHEAAVAATAMLRLARWLGR